MTSWAARRDAAVERLALEVLADPAAPPATRLAARAALVAPPRAEVLRRYDAALATMGLAELAALRRALRLLAEAQGLEGVVGMLSGGPSTRGRLDEAEPGDEPD